MDRGSWYDDKVQGNVGFDLFSRHHRLSGRPDVVRGYEGNKLSFLPKRQNHLLRLIDTRLETLGDRQLRITLTANGSKVPAPFEMRIRDIIDNAHEPVVE